MEDSEIKLIEHTEDLLADRGERRFFLGAEPEYKDIWDSYVTQKRMFWDVDEIDLSKDGGHWKDKLNDNERHFLTHVLAFFAASDQIVMENINTRFDNEVQVQEAKLAYGYQNMIEGVHSATYALLISTLIEKEKQWDVFHAIETIPAVQKKAKWAMKWIGDQNSSFAQRLLAFAAVEGIQFSSSFASIAYIGQRGLMPGLVQQNDLVRRDEAEHVRFATLLYNHLKFKLKENIVHDILREAVEIEHEFCTEALPVKLLGMNAEDMKNYVCVVADTICEMLNYKKIYNVQNPFPFMDLHALENKQNFFETRTTSYARVGRPEFQFTMDETF